MDLVIQETIIKLLDALGISYSNIKVSQEAEHAYYAEIDTAESNLLIGWHGETLTALQHILKCMLWKQGIETKTQIVLDVDGYKKRQEESVIRLAERKAEYACESKRPITLPPMNPYFRRKVHVYLANSDVFKERVQTESVGTEPNRSVKIVPKP